MSEQSVEHEIGYGARREAENVDHPQKTLSREGLEQIMGQGWRPSDGDREAKTRAAVPTTGIPTLQLCS